MQSTSITLSNSRTGIILTARQGKERDLYCPKVITQGLDAIIDMRRSLSFQLAKRADSPLQINPWVIERYDMHCTYSPQLPMSAELLNKALQQLRDQGVIERMLNDT